MYASLSTMNYPEFYMQMLSWRKSKAEELNVEIARIIPQKTLLEIAQTLPATVTELKSIKGMGGKKMTQFGKEILQLVIICRREKGMDLPIEAEKEVKKAGLTTQQQSLELLKSGKSAAEIAHERGFAISTIEGHLAQFVVNGELDIERLVDPDRIVTISNFFRENNTLSLSEARTALGEDYGYGEIRFVTAHLSNMDNS